MTRSCPLCGRDNSSGAPHRYSQSPWVLKHCSGCGMLYLENPPEHTSLEEELAWEKTFASESLARRQRNPFLYLAGRAPKVVVQRLLKRDKLVSWARRFFSPGPILDVGCAGGHTLERLPAEFIPYGIEISTELSRIAGQRFSGRGGHVIRADAASGLRQFDTGFFTGVVMTAFLEHEVNPQAVLESAGRVMRPDARLIVKVPNYASWNRVVRGERWCGFRFPEHVNYFTPRLLKALLARAGLGILRFKLVDCFPTSDNMWLVAERVEGLPR